MMQPPEDPTDDTMVTDDPIDGFSQQNTQLATQEATQEATQRDTEHDRAMDNHLWGFLHPCSAHVRRIDFQRGKNIYKLGRNRDPTKNDIILPGLRISNTHCAISWSGDESPDTAIEVHDLSTNGTFLNGIKIGKGRHALLHEGNEISFGTCTPNPGSSEDYRFVYRHLAAGPPRQGLHTEYTINREIGKGSFATVMRAYHKAEGRWYAVKMIQLSKLRRIPTHQGGSGLQEQPGDARAFEREISILEKLRHPNICQLREVFYERFTINLVLELVEGGDLLDYIVSRERVGEPETQHITYQVCDALAYIHTLGIAHRDLKPENILLTKDRPPIVKVADFGLAKIMDSVTVLRTMCGTPCYLAPEVVRQENNEGYDQVVDSWSVGVIVYSMLSGSIPFTEDDQTKSLTERVRTRQVDWAALRRSGASDVAADFIGHLLKYDPKERMTLTDARSHPWLAQQARIHGLPPRDRRTASPVPTGPPVVDASMRSIAPDDMAVEDEDAHMDDGDASPRSGVSTPPNIPGSYPSGQNGDPDGVVREASRLLRRSDVVAASQETGMPLPSPSQGMRARAGVVDEPDEEEDAGERRAGKRKAPACDGEATPMDEESGSGSENAQQDEAGPSRGKRGRGAAAARKAKGGQKPKAPTTRARGRGRAAPAPTAANAVDGVDAALPPRRSPRVARRG